MVLGMSRSTKHDSVQHSHGTITCHLCLDDMTIFIMDHFSFEPGTPSVGIPFLPCPTIYRQGRQGLLTCQQIYNVDSHSTPTGMMALQLVESSQ